MILPFASGKSVKSKNTDVPPQEIYMKFNTLNNNNKKLKRQNHDYLALVENAIQHKNYSHNWR